MERRIVSVWLPRLASDRALRRAPVEGPFVLSLHEKNAERIYCLNGAASAAGLVRGMGLADARSYCPELRSRPADTEGDEAFLHMLARWARRYCPWVGLEGRDGLVLDITGAAHLMGGEAALCDDLRARLARAGLQAQVGAAGTRGAAWALARYGGGILDAGALERGLAKLPVAALRLSSDMAVKLERLGLRTIGALLELPRSTLARRFGTELMLRLDQALGAQPEPVKPLGHAPHFAVRMSLPEPIGLAGDVMAGTERLLARLCDKLKAEAQGARVLRLTLRRVDAGAQEVELRLARPLRDAARILPLFERGIGAVEAGYGIDQMRLAAVQTEALPVEQLGRGGLAKGEGLDDLITRIGSRIGLENLYRFLPAESHIPERSFLCAAAAFSRPAGPWGEVVPRPLTLFEPEFLAAQGARLPRVFRWRRMALSLAEASGPERIAPEWWMGDESWRTGLRDYWRVQTREGMRLWLFHTPQAPGWYVQGIFT